MPTKTWRVLRPRKHTNQQTRQIECTMCQSVIDREVDSHLTDPEGRAWCMDCGEIIVEEHLGEVRKEKDNLEHTLMKIALVRREAAKQ